jgi:hypothetical protein
MLSHVQECPDVIALMQNGGRQALSKVDHQTALLKKREEMLAKFTPTEEQGFTISFEPHGFPEELYIF